MAPLFRLPGKQKSLGAPGDDPDVVDGRASDGDAERPVGQDL
ncbi:hypothetical protein VDBG_02596 [Verticillium alfalfae VaMs.102]|uniref:Uncharacterized protein n=1 Tax=Verticillium alfalfae (strain VaMs.102 / ATCC MYA-4576 / FGSC 10136) TaxID=526221 RepID=C9SE78_VERA1|nr:hypothetical protein VDBG_02596 [Verticillium alfalfae VaMs.102]EEY16487.1 hypothetical protein VDBG_02596 [Verticillium alfalfae VaMs.102]